MKEMNGTTRYTLDDYFGETPPPVFQLTATAQFSPIGNVPGAHAAEILNYQLSRSDAEYALYAVSHFLHEYFNKIDTAVTKYYTLTIDLNENPSDESTAT